jgi:PAS domain S-box-containing protein
MKAADEIGMLVRSFNQMTEDLQVSRLELEQRKKYMEIILKNVAAGVISTDEKGMVTTINTSAEQMLGIHGEEVIGKRLFEVLAQIIFLRSRRNYWLNSVLPEGIDSETGDDEPEGKSQPFSPNLTNLKDEEESRSGWSLSSMT